MSNSSPSSLRREVLGSFAILFAGGILSAFLAAVVAYPFLSTPTEAVFFLLALLVGDLVAVFLFGRHLLEKQLADPVERLVQDTERIAEGDFRHRVRLAETRELRAVGESVNSLADRLIRDQERLTRNVESLERTNRELMEARHQVVRAARLASTGSLAAGIAHEVGNPLGAIMSYVDVARKRTEEGDLDPDLLDSIREEAVRIDRIVRGLLDYARPESEDTGPADPVAVVEHVLDLLDRQGRLDEVAVESETAEDVPNVHMDGHRLEHVVMNLVLNGLDAVEEREDGGMVGVRVRAEPGGASRLPVRREEDPPGVNYAHRRRVAPEQDGEPLDPLWTAERVVVLRVEDDGPGIDEDDLERIFDPFFSTKEPGKGTGLGLAISARLVEGMGGEIEVENRPQGGAAFEIRLPGVSEVPDEEEER